MHREPLPPVKQDETPPSASASAAIEADLLTYRYLSSEFEKQIKAQTSNVLISAGFAVGVFIVGIIATVYLYRTSGLSGSALEFMKLGTAALSSISLPFPLRAFLQYRVRIPIYDGYKRLFDEAIATGTRVEPYLIEDARAALKPLHKMD